MQANLHCTISERISIRRLAVLVTCVLLLGAGVAPAVAVTDQAPTPGADATAASSTTSSAGAASTDAGGSARGSLTDTGNGSASATRDKPIVHVEFVFSQHPKPGTVNVTIVATPPDNVNKLQLHVTDRVSVESTSGFQRVDDGVWEWDEDETTVAEPSLSTTYQANQTSSSFGGLNYADTNDWALVETPYTYAHWWWESGDGPVYRQSASIADGASGYGGSSMAFLGEAAVHRDTRQGQQFTVVVPATVDSPADPGVVLDTLGFAAERLDVKGRDDGVNVFLAPDTIRGGGRAEYSDSHPDSPDADDVWVRGSYAGDSQTLFHEYAHTRQRYNASERMAWFEEASADYFAPLLRLHAGHADFDEFHAQVSSDEYSSAVLSNPDRPTRADYQKGARVLAALDAKIRQASDGEASLEDVWRRVNEHDGTVTYGDFKDIVANVAGTRMDSWLDKYVTTDAVPDVPKDEQYYVPTESETDADGDNVTKTDELANGTGPFDPDTDADALDDHAELAGPTNATNPDTDGDGLQDGREVELATDPTMADTDEDGLADADEVDRGTDPRTADTDGDGLPDGEEVELGTDPTAVDTDDDGLADAKEADLGTDPTDVDADGDGIQDGTEVEQGTDPLDAEDPTETTTTTEDSGGQETTAAPTEDSESGGSPGFSAGLALGALALAAALLARRD